MEKNKLNGKRGEVEDEMKWVHDSSLDYNGRVPLRASTGAWKASFFIIGKALTSCIYFTLKFIHNHNNSSTIRIYRISLKKKLRIYRIILIFCFDT